MHKKLQELMLYVAQKSLVDPSFDALKLNEILFLIDFTAYGTWGKPISDAKYVHRRLGPAPYELLPAQTELIAANRAVVQELEHFGKSQERLVPLVEPDMSLFTASERKVIDDAIGAFKTMNGTEAGDWTHTLHPWLDTGETDDIPFFTTFALQKQLITRDDMQWGLAELKKLRDAKRTT